MKKTILLLLFVIAAVLCMAADASANPPVAQVRVLNAPVGFTTLEVVPTNRVFVNEFAPLGFGFHPFGYGFQPFAVRGGLAPVAFRPVAVRRLPLLPLRPRLLVLP